MNAPHAWARASAVAPRTRARLDAEHLEVVVEHQDLGPLTDSPGVVGDDRLAVEGLDPLGAEAHVDAAAGEADRHQVEALADTYRDLVSTRGRA